MSLARELVIGAIAAALGAAAGALATRGVDAAIEKAKDARERRKPKVIRP